VTESALREEVCQASRHLYQRGLVVAYEGNVSARLHANERVDDGALLLVTPSRCCKGDLQPADLLTLDAQGRPLGPGTASTESHLHLGIYHQLPNVRAVVHAHPPYTTAFACTAEGLHPLLQPELVLLLGGVPPLAPYAPPGSPELFASVRALVEANPVILLARHGVVATSTRSVMDAVYLVEQVEQVARITWLARQLGPLPARDFQVVESHMRGKAST